MCYHPSMETTSQPQLTVPQASAALRAAARDAAFWLHRAASTDVPADVLTGAADKLEAAITASNDALDTEAFSGPLHRGSRS